MSLTLLTFPPAFGMPAASPFCAKAMCLLRMSGLDWTADVTADVRKTPKQKLPVLVDGAEMIADSSAIQTHLETRHSCDFNVGLSDSEKAHSHALVRMLEEHTYFALMADRWLIDSHWAKLRAAYFDEMPFGIRHIVPPLVRRDVDRTCRGQGMARFSEAEMAARVQQDIDAVAVVLGDKPFLFGDKPSAADASVAPMLDGLVCPHFSDGILPKLRISDALTQYLDRCRDAIFPSEEKLAWRNV